MEYVVTLALLIPAVPVILLSALLVKLTSWGPAFYTQVRLGKNGQPFSIFKIRTMVHDSESLTGARWSRPGDPFITPVGRFLRASHLDELPQLFNVLRGEMALVGPRPERPEFMPALEHAIQHYRLRLVVMPGITGLAQVQLPSDTDLSSVRRKLVYDLYYISKLGFWLDVKLLLCTAGRFLAIPYWFSLRALGVPTNLADEPC